MRCQAVLVPVTKLGKDIQTKLVENINVLKNHRYFALVFKF
jgi:hypothetical protein